MSVSLYEIVKRLMDVVIACILLLLFLPVWIIVPILIRIDSSGPIFFKHKRVGKGGKEFYMYKFRSMVDGAHELLHSKDSQLLEKFKKGDWKLKNDPRITRLGRILRSITIDEFPQIMNVLKGEMSMVGPRAYMWEELTEQTKRYPETKPLVDAILSIKPGVSGPWQVSGRNEVPFITRAKMDAEYAARKSIWRDLLIIVKTPAAMFSKW
jgi:lipopolysaccharide/colanic/teichoic acid biosynthesis glycosyltransferase